MGTIETIAACIGSGALGVIGMGVLRGGKLNDENRLINNLRTANRVIAEIAADRDRASDVAGRLQLKFDAIRDLIETPRTIRKGELRGIVGEADRMRGA